MRSSLLFSDEKEIVLHSTATHSIAPVLDKLTLCPTLAPTSSDLEVVSNYKESVRTFALYLQVICDKFLSRNDIETVVPHAAIALREFEVFRRKVLRFEELPNSQISLTTEWLLLKNHLLKSISSELSAIRDTRLRLELANADIINMRKSPVRVRMVVQGGSAIRVLFRNLSNDAEAKS